MFHGNALLKDYSNYRIGGPARYFVEPQNVDEIIHALELWRMRNPSLRNRAYGHDFFILGGGTNVLFDDQGFQGLVLKPHIDFIEINGPILKVGATTPIDKLLDSTIHNQLSGLEWAGGLPGTVGGAVYGNAGAFGGEMKDLIREVISLDIRGKRPLVIRRTGENCGFNYRSSIFKRNPGREIILEVFLELGGGDGGRIESAIQEKIDYRKQKQPLEYPNIGSIFKNVGLDKVSRSQRYEFQPVIKTDPFPVVPAAYLISEAGLKGVSCGGAMISPKHPNFIVNAMNAKASDVKNLIELVKNKVKSRFGISLEEEIEYV